MALAGGCACGRVRYLLRRPPMFVNCCHCRQCQSLSGSAFALNGMVEADAVERVEGVPARDGGDVTRCPDCGTALWATHRMFGEAILFVRLGTLDDGERCAPDAHFFVRSKHPWIELPAGVPAFDTLPGPDDPPLFGPAVQARIGAAQAAHLAGTRPPG